MLGIATCLLLVGLPASWITVTGCARAMPKRSLEVTDAFVDLGNDNWWCGACGKHFDAGGNLARHLDAPAHIRAAESVANGETRCLTPPVLQHEPGVNFSESDVDVSEQNDQGPHLPPPQSPAADPPSPPGEHGMVNAVDVNCGDSEVLASSGRFSLPPPELLQSLEIRTGVPDIDSPGDSPDSDASAGHCAQDTFSDKDWGCEAAVRLLVAV